MKRKMMWLLTVTAFGVVYNGLQCFPEPDIGLNLLAGFPIIGT
jgi:hypothetical protein